MNANRTQDSGPVPGGPDAGVWFRRGEEALERVTVARLHVPLDPSLGSNQDNQACSALQEFMRVLGFLRTVTVQSSNFGVKDKRGSVPAPQSTSHVNSSE